MAIVAVIAAGNMRWVFAGRNDAVVAGTACTDYLRVVHRVSRNPDIGVMAVFANFRCQNMCRVLAGRFYAIVAARAIAGNSYVIEIRGQPTSCRMAVIAIVAARDMRRMLACRRRAVMARTASTEDLCVVDSIGRRENIGIVTILTNVSCLYMGRNLANGINTVVATGTIIGDTEVVESRWPPTHR